MSKMLINAMQPEELRVGVVSGNSLDHLIIERTGLSRKGNIYTGIITRIEPSLEAAFVDYGAERHGFLPFKEIAPHYYATGHSDDSGRPSIREALREGQELIVQIDKDERGNKGAALTTFISLAGSYLVLMPNNPRAGGISRRIEGDDRSELRELLSSLELPADMGLIIRTAGVGRSQEELQWDLGILLRHWEAIVAASQSRPAPFLIHQESDVIIRSVRDYLRKDINEILIDIPEVYEKVRTHIQRVRPDYLQRVKLYTDNVPLFNRFHIESQIETAHQREVRLPSGGAIVFDPTEALVSIDVNSGRATRGKDIERTALETNLEAAQEIARQLRLRDLGGLIVIDFIDMTPSHNQREVENRLREALKLDRARVQVGRISRFGLLEMSRQRLRPSLGESSQGTCPRCAGHGSIRSVESLALSVMRLIEEEAMKEKTKQIIAQLPVEVATFLLNEKRKTIGSIESRHQVHVLILPNPHLETPQYYVERVKQDDAADSDALQTLSYQRVKLPEEEPSARTLSPTSAPSAEPVIKHIPEIEAQPLRRESGFFSRILHSLFGSEQPAAPSPKTIEKTQPVFPSSQTRQASKSSRPEQQRHRRSAQGRRTPAGGSRSRNEQPREHSHPATTRASHQPLNSQQQQHTEQQQRRRPPIKQAENIAQPNSISQPIIEQAASPSMMNAPSQTIAPTPIVPVVSAETPSIPTSIVTTTPVQIPAIVVEDASIRVNLPESPMATPAIPREANQVPLQQPPSISTLSQPLSETPAVEETTISTSPSTPAQQPRRRHHRHHQRRSQRRRGHLRTDNTNKPSLDPSETHTATQPTATSQSKDESLI